MRTARNVALAVVVSCVCLAGSALAAPLAGDANDDGVVDLDDFVILKQNFGNTAPTTGRPILTVVETVDNYYTVTAHDSVDAELEYWEILVDVQSGGIFSFKDLTDDGDGAGGHNSYLDVDAYSRKTTLVRFSGRGGDAFSRADPIANLADKLTFTTDPEGSSFTIAYQETAATTGYYHGGYEDGERSLSAGELLTTIELVIKPPVYSGTVWDWTISYENVSAHDLSAKIWAVDSRELWLFGGLAKTADSDSTRLDGPWDPDSPVSFARWTMGDNTGLGLTTGRKFIMDCQTGQEGHTYGGGASSGDWAGFDYVAYGAGYDLTAGDALPPGGIRTETGQVIIDFVGEGTSMLPIADAGPDQTVTDMDNTGAEDITLDGSASSDPDGTIASYVWEESSAQVATGVSPTISLTPGTHTIYLIVTDNGGDTDNDSVVITIHAYLNLAPVVEAGANMKIAPGGANLHGQATDDGLPLPAALTTTWTASGPGLVVLLDDSALQTTAYISVDGVYSLELEADDGELTTTDTLTVTVDSTTPAPMLRSSISQYGITWTFDHQYQTGQFANGDYWVVGPVIFIGINPPSEVLIGTTSLTGFVLGGPDPRPRTMNGSMLNPVTPPGGSTQGFDSDVYMWHPTAGRIYGGKYDAAMNVALDVDAGNPLVLQPDSSLVSFISFPNGGRPQLKAAAVLTVLGDVPPDNGAGFFRPPYSGPDKPLYSVDSLRKDLLPNLPLVPNTPALSGVVAQFQRPWIDHFGHIGDGTQYSSPSDNMPDYGREYSVAVGKAALMLMLDEDALIAQQGQNKDELLIRFVQLGIDLYHVTENGGYWWGLGGLNHGRKWPIIFAGVMLDNEHMRTIGSRSKSMPFWGFAEDGQTKYLDQSDVDLTHSPAWNPDDRAAEFIPVEVEDIGIPEWNVGGWAPGLNPQTVNMYFDCPYRVINGMSYPGPILAAHMMGQKEAWDHDALFEYTDRWVPWALIENPGLALYIYGGDFQRDMWNAYRANYPPIWSE